MTIWISREVLLFNFERLDILCAWIGHPCEKLWLFKFLESFRCSISNISIYYVPESDIRVISYEHLNFSRGSVVQFLSVSIYDAPKLDIRVKGYEYLNFSRGSVVQFPASRYIMSPNRTSVWEDRTIWISREVSLFNFERLDILCAWIEHPCEKWWPFEFLERFRCSISSVTIYYDPESDIHVKSYDHLNFSKGFVVQFRASWYIMRPNRTSVSKLMTIWISREVPLLNF